MMRRIGAMGAVALGLLVACGAGRRDAQVAEGGKQPNQIAEGDPSEQGEDGEWGIIGDSDYPTTVQKVVGMVNDPEIRQATQRRGLDVINVAWEDTGRAQGSSLGPNISDLTLQVRYRQSERDQETTALMPVIRFPNFTDRTGDIPANKFFVRAGNHKNKKGLKTVLLTDVLRDIKKFSSRPWSIVGSGNLLAPRDTHFLVSAQAVFLPIPKKGKAEFNPVVFNYQSAPGSPAVLTILVTRQGTSMTVVENKPEDRSLSGWGQELYFNNEGLRAAFTAERRTDVVKRIAAQGGPKTADDKSALARGADALFLIQVPLKHRDRGALGGPMDKKAEMEDSMASEGAASPAPPSAAPGSSGGGMAAAKEKSNVEQAVLGHGKSRGPFEEGANLRLERDDRFPIRITVQFYKATSNGVADDKDLDAIASNIGSVYEHASFVGSLVVPQGDRLRPTEWQKIPNQWFPW
jgi:hypothetical protein